MPTGNLSGWTYAYGDDFLGTSLSADWNIYEGIPSEANADRSWWDPSHVIVSNSVLTLATYQDLPVNPDPNVLVSGGAMLLNHSQAYGKYLVRFRVDAGDGVSYVGLLWPADFSWPPEIDFLEDLGGDRTTTTATVHYDPDNKYIFRPLAGDYTQWHTLGVEWTPGKLTYTIDGVVWSTVENAVEGVSAVPTIPMNLAVQTQTREILPTTPSRVDMEVDWIVIYSYTP